MSQDKNPSQKQTMDSKLARYALAGGALLGVPAAANAGIIYTAGPFHGNPGQTVNINLDPLIDATTDLSIFATGTASPSGSHWIGVNSNGTTSFTTSLNPLNVGDPITLANTNSFGGTLMKATFPGPTYSFPWAVWRMVLRITLESSSSSAASNTSAGRKSRWKKTSLPLRWRDSRT